MLRPLSLQAWHLLKFFFFFAPSDAEETDAVALDSKSVSMRRRRSGTPKASTGSESALLTPPWVIISWLYAAHGLSTTLALKNASLISWEFSRPKHPRHIFQTIKKID